MTTAFAGEIPKPVPVGLRVGATYVAMGSSYAAGPGIAPVVDHGCWRSGRNYPHQVAAALRLRLVDVTCSGATTADVISRRQFLRRSHRYLPLQIDAVSASTKVVTITVGGNDIDYIGRMTAESCRGAVGAIPGGDAVGEIAGRACGAAIDPQRGARRSVTLRQVENALIDIVAGVHQRAPGAKVFLVQYLPVLNDDGSTCVTVPLPGNRAAELAAEYRRLVRVTAVAAARSGATLVGAPNGHRACDLLPWVSGFQLGNPYAGGAIPYHPNEWGATAQAAEVIAAVLRVTGRK
ncbi:SGNH/GDSL hydrolase family protein [Gordonia sp. TBRC 11910]|uniref:SGNH/GDSL hydrolase family protein n=1 Tax=Gordonia asplenii TaxID=2725283 RepID=A0A848L7S9_9ACTN|nr:SGNH/GDSL hydrolase family protein [Gordonia asplenii]NMO04803.1 SGNH/GDSL hydrolase family protein [Gordonia asplenii]